MDGSEPAHRLLFKEGRYENFLEVMERRFATDVAVPPTEIVLYARAAMQVCDPLRILSLDPRIANQAWPNAKFRLQLLIAHLMTGDVQGAESLVRSSLRGLVNDKALLLRIIGEGALFEDRALAVAAALQLIRISGRELKPAEVAFILDVLLRSGRDAALHGVLSDLISEREANYRFYLSNDALFEGNFNRQLWQANAGIAKWGLEPYRLLDEKAPFSVTNVACTSSGAEAGPLVTVAMSTYNSAATVISALTSLTNQMYGNLEILVVDDKSADDTADLVRSYAEQRDARVKLHVMTANGGTYRARNHALHVATGDFFTCLDSDDFAHPRRISSQMELMRRPSTVACQSSLLRVSRSKGIRPRAQGYVQDDMSSVLYRRTTIVERLGYYLEVRTGADSEFKERIIAEFGSGSFVASGKPTLLADWTETSLSGSFRSGISDGGTMSLDRQIFRSKFRRHHLSGRSRYVESGQRNFN